MEYLPEIFKMGIIERTATKEKAIGLAEKILANSTKKGIAVKLSSYGSVKAIEDYLLENKIVKE